MQNKEKNNWKQYREWYDIGWKSFIYQFEWKYFSLIFYFCTLRIPYKISYKKTWDLKNCWMQDKLERNITVTHNTFLRIGRSAFVSAVTIIILFFSLFFSIFFGKEDLLSWNAKITEDNRGIEWLGNKRNCISHECND